jgi:hypothetical protein
MAERKENHLLLIGTDLDYYFHELEEDDDKVDDLEKLIFLFSSSEYYLRQAIVASSTDFARREERIDRLLKRVLIRISKVKTSASISSDTKTVLEFYEKEIENLRDKFNSQSQDKKIIRSDSGIGSSRGTSAEPETP